MATIAEALALAQQHHEAGNLQATEQICRRVLQADPTQPDALHRLGLIASQSGNHVLAVQYLQAAIARQPGNAACHVNLGFVYQSQGQAPEALACFQRAVHLAPEFAAAHNGLGQALRLTGRLEEAVAACREALRLQPGFMDAYNNLGAALADLGDLAGATATVREALRVRPDCATSQGNLGNALFAQQRRQEALACFREAVRLQPNYAPARNNLGAALAELGALPEALAHLQEAVRLQPDLADAHNHLGNTLMQLRRLEEAVSCFREAIRLQPTFHAAYNNLATVLVDRGELDEAIANYRVAAQLQPDSATYLSNLGIALSNQGCLDESVACYRAALRLQPTFQPARTNLLYDLNHDPYVDASGIFDEHCRWGELHGQPEIMLPPPANARDHLRRLRVGYVSPDFRVHPVGFFMEPILNHHDPGVVEVYCYADVAAPDSTTARMQHLAHVWRSTVGLTHAQLAQQIRNDGIDILVDLAGHTKGNRLAAFACRPAPVQVTYLGYPDTTGLKAMNYRLTDEVADPLDAPSLSTEELVRLPGGFCCYQPQNSAPPPNLLPADQTGCITFGSTHALAKLNPMVLDLWCALLRAVPDSRLLVFRHALNGNALERLRGLFAERGIGDERLILRHRVAAGQDHWNVYHDMDIALDPFPWNGHTTACESLWMGVPVVTLRGRRFPGRMVASVLTQLGLNEWIAATPEEYVAVAKELARNRDRLPTLRATLRSQMLASSLCDGARFTRGLEQAFRAMWRHWCALS